MSCLCAVVGKRLARPYAKPALFTRERELAAVHLLAGLVLVLCAGTGPLEVLVAELAPTALQVAPVGGHRLDDAPIAQKNILKRLLPPDPAPLLVGELLDVQLAAIAKRDVGADG